MKHTSKSTINVSRRTFVKAASLTVGAAGALPAKAAESASSKAPLIVAGYPFKRLEGLAKGKVKIEGFDYKFEVSKIGSMNTDVFSGPQSRDITEIGLHPFMLAYANEGFRDYTLLPIFPLRTFRHKSVFIRTDRGIKKPEDLRGKTIATPGYSSTSLTWIRGIFQDEYGIKPTDVKWIVASGDSSKGASGGASKQENVYPDGVPITDGPAGVDESDLLESGKADALFHAAEPRCYMEGHPKVGRLFPDYRSVEQAFFKKTGIFPIMHAIAVKKATLKNNPGLVPAVFKAYSQAKEMDYKFIETLAWAFDVLPWYGQELEETRKLMGRNFYSYGIKPNRKTLEALFRYSYEQGLARKHLTIENLFEPSSLDLIEKS